MLQLRNKHRHFWVALIMNQDVPEQEYLFKLLHEIELKCINLLLFKSENLGSVVRNSPTELRCWLDEP